MAGVLMIIGLLLGGVLKGRQLIEKARIQKIIKQIESYQGAVHSFESRYGALPGDFAQASTTFGEKGKDGNGDGVISGDPFDSQSEAANFWSHLALAEIITNANKLSSSKVPYPSSPLGGGFTVQHNPIDGLEGHWLILGKENGNLGNEGLLTPEQAQAIDHALDNGDPKSGHIQTREGTSASSGDCIKADQYNLSSKKKGCVVYIFLCP